MKIVTYVWAGVFALFLSGPASAWFEPERGTDLRAELMDAIRPQAEAELGGPVQFVVESLRVDGNAAFAALEPQRPGGARIPWEETEMAARGEDPMSYNGSTIHVIYLLNEATWEVIAWTLGAGDVWWSDPQICATHRAVTPEVC